MNKLRRLLHFFYELGVAFHAWAVVVAIVTAALLAFRNVSGSETWRAIAINIAIVGGALLVVSSPPLFLWLRRQTPVIEGLNNCLHLRHLESVVIVTPTSYLEARRLDVRALREVKEYHFSVGPTGNGQLTVSLKGDARLIGPMPRHDRQWYYVVFEEPLRRGQERSLHLEFRLDDPNGTMRPYSRDIVSGAAKFGSLRQLYRFEDFVPEEVLAEEEVAIGAGHPLPGTLRRLTPSADGLYIRDVPKVTTGHAYVISWTKSGAHGKMVSGGAS